MTSMSATLQNPKSSAEPQPDRSGHPNWLTVSLLYLLLAIILLEVGSGLLSVLIPIRGELAGFSKIAIGGLGTSYYLGFVVGCLFLSSLISRFGHIRSFAAIAAIGASAALLHAFSATPSAWLILRAAVGLCFAGLFMVIESWLNDQATSKTRGRVFGLYTAATWCGVIGGSLLFALASPDAFHLFAVASIAISVSLVPIALTPGAVPALPEQAGIHMEELYREAPAGVVGCLAAGLANGAFWTFAPLFAQSRSDSSLGVSLFMSAAVIGGALSQWPIGRFSDRIDRRWIIAGLSLASAATALLLMPQRETFDLALVGLAAMFGAFALALYPICAAHVNDRADPAAFVKVSSHLLMAFGLGAMAGPLLAGFLISHAGIAMLFAFTAAIHAALALFALSRIKIKGPVPEEARATFAAAPPIGLGTPPIFELRESTESNAS